jgi:hypothetical protein
MKRLSRLALLALLGAAGAMPPYAQAEESAGPKTLVISGRVVDEGGWPIAGARIFIASRRPPAAITDDNGRYSLSLFVGPLSGLVQAPFHETLRASLKGWTFAAPGGGSSITVEARLIAPRPGVGRVQVRSNDQAVANSVADALSQPTAMAWASIHFTGRRGNVLARGSEPALSAQAEVPLGGAGGSMLPPAPRTATTRDSARTSPRSPSRTASTVSQSSRPAVPESVAAPDSTPASPRVSATRRAATRPRSWRLFPSVDELLEERRAAARDSAEAARGVSARLSDTTQDSIYVVPPAARVSATSTRSPVLTDSSRARAAAPASSASSRSSGGRRPTDRSAASSAHPGIGTGAAGTAARNVSVVDSATPPGASGAAGDPPERPSPIRVWGGRVVPAPQTTATEAPAPCTCTVRGTVEVRRGRPLSERERVEVSIAGMPAPRDTVELYMGSPRPFELLQVPCGVQRLEVRPLGRRRLASASEVALEPFDCLTGSLRQIHVVLEPK